MRVVKKMRRPVKKYEEWLEDGKMSPAQKEVFIIVDEWWKKFGFSPTLRQIAEMRGKSGVGNTKEIVDRLVRLGALKKLERRRSIRPVYIRYRDVE
jgi:sulfur relay (sulfurtransferase) DsrC/TusE family protein